MNNASFVNLFVANKNLLEELKGFTFGEAFLLFHITLESSLIAIFGDDICMRFCLFNVVELNNMRFILELFENFYLVLDHLLVHAVLFHLFLNGLDSHFVIYIA